MKMNRLDLKKVLYDFNSISSRLLQADYNDHTDILSKYISFIKSTPLIYEYIMDCGPCEQDIDAEFKKVASSRGRYIFTLGDTTEEEVRTVFALLNYIVDNEIPVCLSVGTAYTTSTKYQDCTKAFNDRVVMVLIRHIESYLTKVGIDMGIDEKTVYTITVSNGQVNIANDGSSIVATNNVGIDYKQLEDLICAVKKEAGSLPHDESEVLADSLEVIKEESKSNKPRKKFINTAISAIKAIKGTAEFAAAVIALAQFLQTVI